MQTRRLVPSGVAVVALVTFSLVALAACGGGSDNSASSAKDQTTTTRADGASAYVGLTKKAAIAKAEADGRPWRIGREDGEQFMLTQDLVENRVTFEIDDGKVTKATFG